MAPIGTASKAKLQQGIPATHGFRMPAEWEPHHQCWIGWPEAKQGWGLNAGPAQTAFARVAVAISKFEPVTICASPTEYMKVYDLMKHHDNIRVVEMTTDLCWLRDTGPTFVVGSSKISSGRQVAGIDWQFNGYGGQAPFPIEGKSNKKGNALKELEVSPNDDQKQEDDGWSLDKLIAKKILELEKVPRFEPNLVLEGGNIHVDGEGTCISVEQCLCHPNRNPQMTKQEIEDHLRMYLGVTKIIWVPRGLYGDDSINGHIDNMCCFVRPGVVLLTWTDDKSDPQYERSMDAFAVLSNTTDAKGRKLEIIKLHVPGPLYMTKSEVAAFSNVSTEEQGETSQRLAASYMNFYRANGGLVVPAFGDKRDQEAYNVLSKAFPDEEVVMFEGGREIVLGGGNIHCATQQQPAFSTENMSN